MIVKNKSFSSSLEKSVETIDKLIFIKDFVASKIYSKIAGKIGYRISSGDDSLSFKIILENGAQFSNDITQKEFEMIFPYLDISNLSTMYAMFAHCSNIVSLDLSSWDMSKIVSCQFMFGDCTKLRNIKINLNKDPLDKFQYLQMFKNCKSLVEAPSLPAKIVSSFCYSEMFYGCKSLHKMPNLPATDIENAPYCYKGMFKNSGISEIDLNCLPAKFLSPSCYTSMFENTLIEETPTLPCKAYSQNSYEDMFKNCKKLRKINELHIFGQNLKYPPYKNMFKGCTNIEPPVKLFTKGYKDNLETDFVLSKMGFESSIKDEIEIIED